MMHFLVYDFLLYSCIGGGGGVWIVMFLGDTSVVVS
jgi:hypothetical protein